MKRTAFFLMLAAVALGGCFLDSSGKDPVPSDPARVYYWYTDGTVSVGHSYDPVAHSSYYPYTVDPFKQIIAVAIANDDHVYYWYDDNTTSSGTSDDPTKYRDYYPSNRDPARALLGVGIAGDNRVYYWYSGGTKGWASAGTTDNPTAHRDYYQADIMMPSSLLEPIAAGIDGFYDNVFYWYPNQMVSSGTSDNATVHRGYYDSNLNKEVVGIAIRNGKL